MTSQELSLRTPELERFRQLGRWLSLAETGNQDEAARGAAAALRLAYVEALGLPLLAASELSVDKRGNLIVGAKLVRALAAKAGYHVKRKAVSAEACTAVLVRADTGEVIGEDTYTFEEARRAGLIRDGSAWKTHPDRMLWARASKRVVDDFAPQVSLGLATPEEVDEIEAMPLAEEDLGPVEPEAEADLTPADDPEIEWPGEAPQDDPSDYPPAEEPEP